jgi:hypothetical protein
MSLQIVASRLTMASALDWRPPDRILERSPMIVIIGICCSPRGRSSTGGYRRLPNTDLAWVATGLAGVAMSACGAGEPFEARYLAIIASALASETFASSASVSGADA